MSKHRRKLRERVEAAMGEHGWQFRAFASKLNIHMKPEYNFYPTRKWQFDYAFPSFKVAVEIRGRGYLNDLEKLNQAQLLGWAVLQFPPDDIDFDQVEKVILNRWRMQFAR